MAEPASDRLTRRQLYELVWKDPVEDVAKRFGISGRGLGKLCDRHSIPVPPRGYWARKAAGQKIKRPPLLELDEESTWPILTARASTDPAALRPAPPPSPTPWADLYQEQLAAMPKIRAPKTLANPHPVVALWIKRDEEEKRSRPAYLTPRAETQLSRRRTRFLNALYLELDKRGFSIQPDRWRRSPDIKHRYGTIDIDVEERSTRTKRELTKEERAGSYGRTYSFVTEPTGLLQFRFKSHSPQGVPDRWVETAEEPLETKLAEIVTAFMVIEAAAKARAEEEARAYEIRREAERRAREREEERQRQLARHRALVERAAAWREARDIREYVAAVRAAAEASTELEEWVGWALARADAVDPLIVGDACSDIERPTPNPVAKSTSAPRY